MPSQDTRLGCGLDPQSGAHTGGNQLTFHSLSLPHLPPSKTHKTYSSVKSLKNKKKEKKNPQKTVSVGQDVEKLESLCTIGGKEIAATTVEAHTVWRILKK